MIDENAVPTPTKKVASQVAGADGPHSAARTMNREKFASCTAATKRTSDAYERAAGGRTSGPSGGKTSSATAMAIRPANHATASHQWSAGMPRNAVVMS